ncbi:MAG: serine/threonine protein kinase [Gemmatimonadetes bacterium]|nr:serine/threonine protein kinase [Gemmatimonadota bacterium]
MIGERVGNYRVTDRLGEGGMGTVYRAQDEMLDREVALKVMRPEVSRQPGLHERFRQEAVALARLNHPRIAAVYGLERHANDLVMVLEFVRGETLEAIVHRSGHLDWRRAFELGAEALEGLEHAHLKGVVHRDIKPANIMLARDGHVKVMDFGIARLMGSSRQTRMGAAVGTPMYMSPEQLRGEDVDGRSDLYSLACVLYELITGRLAFEADSDYELMMKQLNTPAPPVRATIADAPAVVDEVLGRAMAKGRDDRYPHARAMAEALRAARGAGPVVAPGPTPHTRLADVPMARADREVPVATLSHTADAPAREVVPATRLAAPAVAATRIAADVAPAPVPPRPSPLGDWRLWAAVAVLALGTTALLKGRSDEPTVPPSSVASDTTPTMGAPVAPPPATVAAAVSGDVPPALGATPGIVGEKAGPIAPPEPAPRPASTGRTTPRSPAAAGARKNAPTEDKAPPPPVITPPPATPAPVVTEPPAASKASAEADAVPNAAAIASDVGRALDDLAGAMGSGDAGRVGSVLRVDDASGWLDLVKERRLLMSVEGTPEIEVESRTRATARFRASLNVRSAFGANRKRPAQFVAELSRSGGGWRVTSLRPVGAVSIK